MNAPGQDTDHGAGIASGFTTGFSMTPVATIHSCYPERFGIPRQSGLVASAKASVVLPNNEYNLLSIRGLEEFSHIWIVFLFHQQKYRNAKPLVNPPRLGGKASVGVFSTRSPNRPNPIGLSAVEIDNIEKTPDKIFVHIKSGDFLDGTPVLDIKPYVPFVDSIAEATSNWAGTAEPQMPVSWLPAAANQRDKLAAHDIQFENLQSVIEESIAQDPRPAYERKKDGAAGQSWGMRISRYNIRWEVHQGTATIVSIEQEIDR